MIDCKLGQINHVKHTIPVKIDLQTHDYDELTYFISGNGTTEINGKVYDYSPSTFAFYKMGTVHNEIDPEPCEIIWTHFSFNMKGIDLKEGVFPDRDGKLLRRLKKLRGISLKQSLHNSYLTECCVAEIVAIIAEKQSQDGAFQDSLNWNKILDYIDSNITVEINFSLIAKQNGYSYDRFRHIFKSRFGLSPYAYLTAQRIEHAKRLLEGSTSSITDIAFDCGFNSSSQFTNIFKKHIGLTPKEYKAEKKLT